MRIACWIPKATNTHSEYVILIALPRQQWLGERNVVLYVHCCLVLKKCSRLRNIWKNLCLKGVKSHSLSFWPCFSAHFFLLAVRKPLYQRYIYTWSPCGACFFFLWSWQTFCSVHLLFGHTEHYWTPKFNISYSLYTLPLLRFICFSATYQ